MGRIGKWNSMQGSAILFHVGKKKQSRIVFTVSNFTWIQTTNPLLPTQSEDCESNPVSSYREV